MKNELVSMKSDNDVFCSMICETKEEKVQLYNAINNADASLDDMIGKQITIVNVYAERYTAEDEEEANEIFSDNQSRIDMMDRIIRRKMLPIVAIFLCCVIPQAVRMADGMYTDRVSIAFYILWVILIVLYVYLIARSTAGFARLRKKYAVEK